MRHYVAPVKPGVWAAAAKTKHVAAPMRSEAPQPGDAVYIYLPRPTSAFVGKIEAGVVFIAPRENIQLLLEKLGVDMALRTRSRYIAVVRVGKLETCIRPIGPATLGISPPAYIRRIEPKVAAALDDVCLGRRGS